MIERAPYLRTVFAKNESIQAKFMYELTLGKMLQPEMKGVGDRVVSYLRAANVQWQHLDLTDIATMYASDDDINALSLKAGDLLVCEGGEVGRAALLRHDLGGDVIIQNSVHRVRGRNGNSARYLGYVLQYIATSGWFDVICNRATIAHFTVDKFGELQIPCPMPEEQNRIADYLDDEVAKIERLVEAKQNLLKLLTEKRRARIASAVTQGLKPAPPMRDSGIEWLAQVPAHWAVFPLRRLIASLDQGWSPVASNLPAAEGEHGVLKLSAIKGGHFIPHENKALLPMSDIPKGLDIQRGDVLLTRANTPSLVGDAAMVEDDFPALVFSDLIYRLRVNPSMIDPRWLVQVLISDTGRQQIEAAAKGSSGSMVKLGQDQVLGLLIPLPPIAEQIAIVSTLGKEIKTLQRLATTTAGTIDLLKDRRTTLIADAVAGKGVDS